MSAFSSLLCSVGLLLIVAWQFTAATVIDVDMKPGGKLYTAEIGDFGMTCRFEYKCQGGTNELWRMEFKEEEGERLASCIVTRPGHSTSYLFFETFKLEIIGGTIDHGDVMGNNKLPVSSDQYVVNEHEVRSASGKFKNQLTAAGALITAYKPWKREL